MLQWNRIQMGLSLFLILLLINCAPKREIIAFDNSPEGVVRKILDGIEKQDANQFLDALDPALRDQPNYFFASALVKGVQSYLGLEGAGDLNQVAFRELQFQTSNDDGTTAHVSVSGKVRNLATATESDFNGEFFTKNIDGTWYVSDQNTMLSSPSSGAAMELVTMDISSGPSQQGAGWTDITIQFAAENRGGKPYRGAWPPEGTVQVAEGFTYPVIRQGWADQLPPVINDEYFLVVPPGFRVRGPLYVATVAEATHPVSVRFEGGQFDSTRNFVSGEFNIENPVSNLVFPTDPAADVLTSIPDTIELPGMARIAVTGFSPETNVGLANLQTNRAVMMQVEFENLNIGQEQTLNFVEMAFLDGNGVYQRTDSPYVFAEAEGSCFNAVNPDYGGGTDYWPFNAGPGQTKTSTICIPIGEPTSRGALSSHNLKVLFWLNEDVWRVYDTGF